MRSRKSNHDGHAVLLLIAVAMLFALWTLGNDPGPETPDESLPADVAESLDDLRDGRADTEPTEPPKELRPEMAWEVSGAGTAAYDGVYQEDGEFNGQMSYKLDGSHYLFYAEVGGLNYWVLYTGKASPMMNPSYYCETIDGAWTAAGADPPAPTVAEYVPPPTPPDPDDTSTKRTGWIGGPLSPTLFPCQTVKPARFVGTDANEYVAFVGRTSIAESSQSVVLYCVDTDTWMALRGQKFATAPSYNAHWYAPQTCLLHAGDGETLWFVDRSSVNDGSLGQLLAYPLTLDIANLTYSVGSLFAPGIVMGTDIAVDDANTAWFMTFDPKLYSWDLTGAAVSLVKDWSTGRTEHGGQAGPRFWYSGIAGTFYRTHNPYFGVAPDYIHRVSSSVYEYMGESVPIACVSYDHDGPRDLTYGMGGWAYITWRYRPGAGDAWQGAALPDVFDHVWVIRGTPMMMAGVNDTVLI